MHCMPLITLIYLENGSFSLPFLPETRITFSLLLLPVRNILDGVSTAANMLLLLV